MAAPSRARKALVVAPSSTGRHSIVSRVGTVRVAVAWTGLPFGSVPDRPGLDLELMTALADVTGESVELVVDDRPVERVITGDADCVSITATAERAAALEILPPYVRTGQALAVDAGRLPGVRTIADLAGRTIGVEEGQTSGTLAERLVAEGGVAGVRRYPTGALAEALGDLSTGGCDAVLAFAPAIVWHLGELPAISVVDRGLTDERVAVAAARGAEDLAGRLRQAQADLEADGTLQRLRRRWLGNPFADQTLRTV
jgi:polar amino acid transport system substrate-binding protein